MNTRRTRIKHRQRRRGPSRLVMWLFGGILAFGMVATAGVVVWIVVIASTGPEFRDLKPRQQGTNSQIFASNGTSLGFLQARVVRQPIASTLVPDAMRQATVAVEDRRFYDHKGVDFEGVVRASFRNLASGKTVEGGSTLTMQLIRTLYASNERNITRKIREAKLAEELENVHPGAVGKRYILNQYLNNVPYGTIGGQEIIGVQAAARSFYGVAARELTLPQAAMIAGLPQAPTQYNPLYNPKSALKRRNDVLSRMEAQAMITPEQSAEAQASGLTLKPSDYYSRKKEDYVFQYVKAQLVAKYGRATVAHGGLKVYTSIDLKKQNAARAAIASQLNFADPPSAAIISLDPKTGQIVAMASSDNYSKSQFNLATQNARNPGSTFKTMGLMAAVRKGVVPESTYYVSKPINIPTSPWGKIEVKTYSGTYSGSMNLVTATLKSDNAVFIQLALDVGPDLVKKAAVDMGITAKLDGNPSAILGGLTYGVTPLEMARAYSTINNGGYKVTPTAITKVIIPKTAETPQRIDDLGHPKRAKTFKNGVTGEVTKILEQNVQKGTGGLAQTQCPTAGKTGTTDNFRDAWFAGFTPNLTSVIWVGYPAPRVVEMRTQYGGSSVAGGTFPAKIWGIYMKEALKGKPCGAFPKITEENTASKFEGKYAKSGGDGTGDSADSTTPTGTTGTTTPKKTTVKTPDSTGKAGNGNGGTATPAPQPDTGTPGNGNGGVTPSPVQAGPDG